MATNSLTPMTDPPAVDPGAAASAFETIIADTKSVACNGGGGPLGHPRVYLNMGTKNDIVCPYCSRHFVLAGHTGTTA